MSQTNGSKKKKGLSLNALDERAISEAKRNQPSYHFRRWLLQPGTVRDCVSETLSHAMHCQIRGRYCLG